jgi:ZIP family zinc transporter
VSDTRFPQPATPSDEVERPRSAAERARWVALGLLPLVLLAAVLALIVVTDAGLGDRVAPPIENLSVERVALPAPNQVVLDVFNNGPDAVTVAQVLVDDAYWSFTMTPGQTLGRLESARVAIPYPWVAGEAHSIGLVSRNGVVFEATVPVAVQAPQSNAVTVARFALLGTYVGIIPVGLGLLWYPFLRRLGSTAMRFILALTIGLLVFLIVDMFQEAQELAVEAPPALKGALLVPVLALLTFLLLLTLSGRKRDVPRRGLGVAYRIALGIGLHNLGEGLAIGAAFALGEVALGVFLVLGFTLHNVTEGVGIAAPILREQPALRHFLGLALLAGAPAILGVWIGGFVFSAFWTTVFLAIGIGAIAQVIVELGRIVTRGATRAGAVQLDWATLGGVTTGIAIMYATALLVAA